MVEMTSVEGIEKAKIVLFALSTCGWCAKTKGLLDNLGLRYSYVYVDLLSDADTEEVLAEVKRWNPDVSFPTTVINDQVGISGYKPDKILEAIG